ncbi:hypothetical protein ACFFHM_18920 [Halalkalibacter kiskunsagensis]|uniref:Uncharacterized protein n=1 Tax=Halalkalibacter kiskunsagensis TaxID=1548599 RepID=A0ABV6KHR7_9BACI
MSVKTNLNAMKRMNDKMYPKLNADDRFKMVIKTFVNDDEVQRDKLVKSCPKATYSESEHAYTERIEASRDIVTVFIIQLLEYDKIISIMKILNGFHIKEQEYKTEMKLFTEVNAFLLAFETFCREHVGIDSKDMIQAWYGYDERFIKKIENIKQLLDLYPIYPDLELKDLWLKNVFVNEWNNRVKPVNL